MRARAKSSRPRVREAADRNHANCGIVERTAMANWCNIRLVVHGPASAVKRFATQARRQPDSLFRDDMLQGEGMDLEADPTTRLAAGTVRKSYRFQGRNDDGRGHFRKVSRAFPRLTFIVVWDDVNDPRVGSYLIRRGRSKRYVVPQNFVNAVFRKHGLDYENPAFEGDEDEGSREMDATLELMDLAQTHWESSMRGEGPPKRRVSRRVGALTP